VGARVIDRPFKFDEIGSWSELKLEIVEKYGAHTPRPSRSLCRDRMATTVIG
jgi:hypothetical protein